MTVRYRLRQGAPNCKNLSVGHAKRPAGVPKRKKAGPRVDAGRPRSVRKGTNASRRGLLRRVNGLYAVFRADAVFHDGFDQGHAHQNHHQ